MDKDTALAAALVDVRKAFRLIWIYQRRAHDIFKLIAEEFEDMGFYYWSPTFAGSPPKLGTNPTGDRWGWDFMPMIQASFLYLQSEANRNATLPGQWMLEINLVSDSGCVHSDNESEPDPENFKAAAECTSSIVLRAWYCTGETNRNWFNDVWKNTDWPKDGEISESADPPFKIYGKTFDLAELPEKETVRAATVEFKNSASRMLGVTLS